MRRSFSIMFFSLSFIIMNSCAQKKDYVVTIKTSYGDIAAILYDETPKHKANFIKLAREHFFDGTLFHRVIEGFMIQGGDPESKTAVPGQPLGRGGPGYTVDAEFNPKFIHERGSLAAARMGDQANPMKASNGSQFYIVQGRVISESELTLDPAKYELALRQFFQNAANRPLSDSLVALLQAGDTRAYQDYLIRIRPRVEKATGMNATREVSPERLKAYTTVGGAPDLDGGYTVFGKVIKGMDVVDKIAAVQKDSGGERPAQDISMTVTVEELSKKKIEQLYGYKYE